jgi:hypothetical protein
MKKTKQRFYFIFTLLFFILGFFNILFAWLGFLCMILPFTILFKTGKNKWCQTYCPRANLYTTLFKRTKSRPSPKWVNTKWAKKLFLGYFIFNIFILILSTIMVVVGRIQSMEMVRILFAFQLPWDLPQLINLPNIPTWSIHLSFRIYSMMLTTTSIGLVLGYLYRPRTWCTICPVMTLSNMYLSNQREKACQK